jgi:hypothetical protein
MNSAAEQTPEIEMAKMKMRGSLERHLLLYVDRKYYP